MIIRLQKYDLEVRYEKGSKMSLADTLSRAFLPAGEQDENELETINMMKYLSVSEERLLLIQHEAEESLQLLKAVIQKGWLNGERVVIPRASRSELLRRTHSSHLGVKGCLNRAC